MQTTVNPDNTVTLQVNQAELALLDYGLGYFCQHAVNVPCDDIDLANSLEQHLWTQYCRLTDQIERKSTYGSLDAQDAAWAHKQLTGE